MKDKLEFKIFKDKVLNICEQLEEVYKNSVVLNEYCKQKEVDSDVIYYITPLTKNIRKSLDKILIQFEKLYSTKEKTECDFIKNIKPLNPDEYIIED